MVATLERKPLGQLLLGRGLIKAEQIERALEEQRRCNHQKLLGEVLVEQQSCTENQITEVLAQAYGVPYARISPRIADPKAVASLPRDFLEKHTILPLFLVEGTLTVAVPEPANVFLLEEIERLSGHPVQVVAATMRDIKATLQTYLPSEHVFVIDDIIEDVLPESFALIERPTPDVADLELAAGDAPVVKLVNYCIYNAVRESASDVHIEPGDGTLRVRYRVDGRLVERIRPPFQMHAAVTSRIKIMARLDVAEHRLPQDGSIHVMLDKRPIDLRVSTMPGKYGEKIVIRVIDNDKGSANLEKLGFSYDTLKAWRKLIALPSGLLLVTGPNGGGMGSTLYASLKRLNADELNICTLEETVHYAMHGVNQFQVSEKVGLTFSAALRAVLRQDPDVLMIGEIRDSETAKIAAQAALSGKLVLSTLHTNDAPSAITRLYNLGIEPYVVGASLSGVLAQRLVRKLCQTCRQPYAPSINERRQLEKVCGNVDTLFRPKGCARCHNLGYTGRIGIYELLTVDDAMVEKISQGAPLPDLRETARIAGMKTLRVDGLDKVKAGITTLDEVFRVTG